ncbi:MAG TPA: hypothetical protein VMV92_08140 [Streptosporangiaceae bacterium]|nr:hypothetical protein [Streptosporangiaceae bacterium]
MSGAYPERRFQLWEYRVSHGSLLIRSPKGPDAGTNIDLEFSGVEYVACPRLMRGLELAQASSGDLRRVRDAGVALEDPDKVFVLLSGEGRHLVVASSCLVSENTGDIFDSPFV